jgi:AcrR family transcriptional regulator
MAARKPRAITATQQRGETFVSSVLEATLAQLAERGFDRLAIPHIAQHAGVNKTSIYRRWPTKAELVRDALAAAMSHTDDAPDTGTLRNDLIALARTVATFTQSRVGTAVIRIMHAESGNPEVRALATMAYGEAAGSGPWAVMRRAVMRGELKDNVDPTLLLFAIAGAIMHRVFVEHADVTDEFIVHVIDMMLYGVSRK